MSAGAALLLAGALGAAWWFLRGGGLPLRSGNRFVRWMARAALAFVLPVGVALALLGRIEALWVMPAEFAGLRDRLPMMAPDNLVFGTVAGVVIGLAVAAFRARRGARPIGRPGALMPRNRRELGWGAAVALVAGVTEEPFFRLLLPLLIALATGNALLGFGVAALIFGAMHAYQGWRGVVATTLFGGVMAAVYLVSGALWLVMLLHALIDLNGLVVWPALRPVSR
ncbi:CPBP family intramembrane metalloprotease [Sphingomonas sp. KR1UV-12]|uniref:CPBP family intramembrane metalloprotease n=1 Tax=Sphingomonas aurea TaxID=3063994 RepID=A0ABT9EN46_9SPHN|nr:CPBP family intramembrane glutamic endopeptidase [Sphingomonas sp. KR1UV-12]MDP1028382.1 CPBP family intramembrane metalloprotease [Sphingomonas sp. KR1UV-12]